MIDFLLRATTGHHSDLPCAFSRPHTRSGSPCPGGSTLMTSAPMSPSSWPQNGPASSVPSSMTRRSESGPFAKRRRSCSTTLRPACELRLLRRFEAGLLFAASLQLLDRVEAAIEQLLLAALARHAFAQGCRRVLVDAVIVVEHNAIATRAFARDQARLDVELHAAQRRAPAGHRNHRHPRYRRAADRPLRL